jgi:hypothetical protein
MASKYVPLFIKLLLNILVEYKNKYHLSITGNMKIITSIYLHCRPDLRDEWIASSDADAEIEDALVSNNARLV